MLLVSIKEYYMSPKHVTQFGEYYILLNELCNVTGILLQGVVPELPQYFDKPC